MIIYGAGAIGGVVGGHLARAGYDVILIGRPGHVNAIRERGLRLITSIGTYTLRVPAVTGPAEIEFRPNDLVFLCVKGQNTEEAVRDLRAAVEDVPVFCFQNGVRNEEIVSRYFPRVYGVMVRVGGVYLTDGEVIARRDPPGWLIMGRYPSGVDELVERAALCLRTAGFFIMVTPDVMPYKWGKLMGNLANAIGAITNARGEDNERIAEAARQEARELLEQAGIRWISGEKLAREWPEIRLPPRHRLDVEAQSSTWQSLARRQGSVETDFLNGEIVRLAERLGRQAPINEALLRISQEMAANREPPGKYTPAQLCELLGLS
ncbi:MAG TPA: 2-dehydropantoate 2-reductase [Caldilineae bacterium]|nr:2-dehydropantoate 2-reductase [Caldilineae bacterium]